MTASKKDLPPYQSTENYDDDDYEEGFEEGNQNDDDEMERLKKAMAKEKFKAQKYN